MFNINFEKKGYDHYKVTVGVPGVWEYNGDFYELYGSIEAEMLRRFDMSRENYYKMFNKEYLLKDEKRTDYCKTLPSGRDISWVNYALADESGILFINLESRIETIDCHCVEKYGYVNYYVVDKNGNTTDIKKVDKGFNRDEVQDYILKIIRDYLEKDLEDAKNNDKDKYNRLCGVKEAMKIALAKRNIEKIAEKKFVFAKGYDITIWNRLDDREFLGLKLDTLKEFVNERTTPKKIEINGNKATCECGKEINIIDGMKFCPYCGKAIDTSNNNE